MCIRYRVHSGDGVYDGWKGQTEMSTAEIYGDMLKAPVQGNLVSLFSLDFGLVLLNRTLLSIRIDKAND